MQDDVVGKYFNGVGITKVWNHKLGEWVAVKDGIVTGKVISKGELHNESLASNDRLVERCSQIVLSRRLAVLRKQSMLFRKGSLKSDGFWTLYRYVPILGKIIDVSVFRIRDKMGKVTVLEACAWFDALGFEPEIDEPKTAKEYQKIMVERGYGSFDAYGRFHYHTD